MNKLILGLVGEIGSGKGIITEYLIKNHQAATHKFSTSLRDILKRLYLEVNRDNLQEISRILREKFGQNLLAKIITEDVAKDSSQIIIIDGIRRFADIEYLKKLPEFKLVYITADINTRFERIKKRAENKGDAEKTFEQFQKESQSETEKEITEVGQTADFTITNEGTLEELHQQIEDVIKKL